MSKQTAEQEQPSRKATLRSTRGHFWASTVALITILIVAIDTQMHGLLSLPLSIAEAVGGAIFGMISALSIRITCTKDVLATPAVSMRKTA